MHTEYHHPLVKRLDDKPVIHNQRVKLNMVKKQDMLAAYNNQRVSTSIAPTPTLACQSFYKKLVSLSLITAARVSV